MASAGYTSTIGGACSNGTKWSVDITTELLDATTFCSNGSKEYIEGLKGGTFTVESFERIETLGTGASVVFANDEVSIEGVTYLTNESISTDVNGLNTFVYSGNFSGTVTVTGAGAAA